MLILHTTEEEKNYTIVHYTTKQPTTQHKNYICYNMKNKSYPQSKTQHITKQKFQKIQNIKRQLLKPAQTKQLNKTQKNSENRTKTHAKQRVNKVPQHNNTSQNIIQTIQHQTAKKHENITHQIRRKTNTTFSGILNHIRNKTTPNKQTLYVSQLVAPRRKAPIT